VSGKVPEPIVYAFVLAEVVHQDSITSKVTIVGTFNQVQSSSFPTKYEPFGIYLAIAGFRGRTAFQLRLIDMDELREPLIAANVIVAPIDPNQTVEFAEMVPSLTFPEPGIYRFQLILGGEILRERLISFDLLDSQEQQAEQ
jgi:hypothetical protein